MPRANPFTDLSDFETQTVAKPVPVDAINALAEESGFTSRHAQPTNPASDQPKEPRPVQTSAEKGRSIRRYTTGRNRQLNIKATNETIERFYQLADQYGVPLGALLEQALEALENKTIG
jgi:hypothetical protein